ncbi:MAG: hypothetical protein H6622_00055 [Halobacteriovoraceae bacterium]|nr:hypothetical protein [Halobacteriovoraceae bacterium]
MKLSLFVIGFVALINFMGDAFGSNDYTLRYNNGLFTSQASMGQVDSNLQFLNDNILNYRSPANLAGPGFNQIIGEVNRFNDIEYEISPEDFYGQRPLFKENLSETNEKNQYYPSFSTFNELNRLKDFRENQESQNITRKRQILTSTP